MILDYHSQFCQRKRIGYTFKNAEITVVNPSFADDITLAASDANGCQESIDIIQDIVTWTKLWHSSPANVDHGLADFSGSMKKPNLLNSKTVHTLFMIPFLQLMVKPFCALAKIQNLISCSRYSADNCSGNSPMIISLKNWML